MFLKPQFLCDLAHHLKEILLSFLHFNLLFLFQVLINPFIYLFFILRKLKSFVFFNNLIIGIFEYTNLTFIELRTHGFNRLFTLITNYVF